MSRLTLLLLLFLPFFTGASTVKPGKVSRSQFPKCFLFGTASSAYQEDVKIMKDTGFNAYRFSISWTRILPRIEPFVTLFHWDSPQALEQLYGGFLSHLIVEDFRDYADVCFREFGDRVKNWITFNEPWSFSIGGYSSGFLAPGRCSSRENSGCTMGDSGREPYIVAHNQLLLAHAAAVQEYKDRYQDQKGKIGITIVSNWIIPYSNSKKDQAATKRALDFMYGWFMDPLTKGDYPVSMRTLVGNRLPQFTEEQSKAVNGSFDFIGLNYYTARYAQNTKHNNNGNTSYNTDSLTNQTVLYMQKQWKETGQLLVQRVAIAKLSQADWLAARRGSELPSRPGFERGILLKNAGSPWLYIYPKGIEELLLYTKKTYNNPTIYITENGVDEVNNEHLSLQEALNDNTRIEFYRQHLFYIQRAINDDMQLSYVFEKTKENFKIAWIIWGRDEAYQTFLS
ncbi:hypothetical protein PR202_ga17049 [Eleusine coracana subsp. coracana]|uniref:Beta-glucosidase n=1 Tax=Eleusine coracana subsp. coracana TaxID=191504 RepID=A0AAV5CPH6_ELECO|nr:hypothetical protein PR202_ga17049 [Eleusine coracana subsp. coracana]